jgi:hypothetical protein
LPPDVKEGVPMTQPCLAYSEKKKDRKKYKSDFMAFVKHVWPEFIEGGTPQNHSRKI